MTFVDTSGQAMIWPQHKLSVMPINKVASTSLAMTMNEALPDWQKGDVRDILRNEDWLIMAMVRDPWVRMMSLYGQKVIAKPTAGLKKLGIYKEMEFGDFLDIVCDIPDDRADMHFVSQAYVLTGEDGRMLPNHIIHLEKIKKQWPVFQELLKERGLSVGILRKQKTRRRLRKDAVRHARLVPQAKERVRDRYADDYRLFYP